MRDIHCPKDIGFENTFSGEDCEKEQYYNNCYHCWPTALAKEKAHWKMSVQNDGMSEFKRCPLMIDKTTINVEKHFKNEECEQFLLKPASGWTRINIPGLDDPDMVLPASYITDVPNDCLDTMINALENNMDFSVSFDAEGWDFKVISDTEDTYVIVSKDAYKVYHSDINKFKLGELLYQDILNYGDAWAMWNPGTDIGDMQLEENKLMRKLNKLKLLLNGERGTNADKFYEVFGIPLRVSGDEAPGYYFLKGLNPYWNNEAHKWKNSEYKTPEEIWGKYAFYF